MCTTLDIGDPILRNLKQLQPREGKSLGWLVSDLLAASQAARREAPGAPPVFRWAHQHMAARVDLRDKDAVMDAIDELDQGFLAVYQQFTGDVPTRGNLVPDAHLAAILRQNGVATLYTHERDFRRFTFLDARDPLTAAAG